MKKKMHFKIWMCKKIWIIHVNNKLLLLKHKGVMIWLRASHVAKEVKCSTPIPYMPKGYVKMVYNVGT
jgi:hypothetical protein